MTAQTKTTLKGYFNTNDTPTEAQFANLIDSIGIHGVLVAAYDAPVMFRGRADYVCDGIDDDVEIQAALALGNGKVFLSAGDFVVSSTIAMPANTSLIGQGIGATIMACAAAYNDEIISMGTSCVLEGMTLAVSTDATANTIEVLTKDKIVMRELRFTGGNSTTPYTIYIDSAFSYRLEHIFIETAQNGVMISNTANLYNVGNATIAHVEITPNLAGTTGWYIVGSAAKNVNIISFSYISCLFVGALGVGSTGMKLEKARYMTFNTLDLEGADTELTMINSFRNVVVGMYMTNDVILDVDSGYNTFIGGNITAAVTDAGTGNVFTNVQ